MKSWLRTSRRALSFVLTAVLLATAVMAVLPARADARSGHCKAPCRHCQTSSTMTCCGTDRSEPSSLPLQTSTTSTQAQHAATLLAAAFVSVPVTHAAIGPSAVRFAPPHGYRTTDLPILNAVFLI